MQSRLMAKVPSKDYLTEVSRRALCRMSTRFYLRPRTLARMLEEDLIKRLWSGEVNAGQLKIVSSSKKTNTNGVYIYVLRAEDGSGDRGYLGISPSLLHSGQETYLKPGALVRFQEGKIQTVSGNKASMFRVKGQVEIFPAETETATPKTLPSLEESFEAEGLLAEERRLISDITPYVPQEKLKFRVLRKPALNMYETPKGKGQVFNIVIGDESGEIRLIGFNDQAENFYPLLTLGKTFILENYRVVPARSLPNQPSLYEYELQTTSETIIKPAAEDHRLPSVEYNFRPLDSLQDVASGTAVDIIGVIHSVEPVTNLIVRATGKETAKRDVQLIDQTECTARITLWRNEVDLITENNIGDVVVARQVNIKIYQEQVSLNKWRDSELHLNSSIPQAGKLFEWYRRQGRVLSVPSAFSSESSRKRPLVTAREGQTLSYIGQADNGLFSITATLSNIYNEGTISYPSCPAPRCFKKVFEEGSNAYRCEKCDKTYETCLHRYVLAARVIDNSGVLSVTMFNEVAQELLGHEAQELLKLREENNAEYVSAFKKVLSKEFVFEIQAKREMYLEEERWRGVIQGVQPIDYEEEALHRLDQILLRQ